MSIVNGTKIGTMVSAANGDTYGDGLRHELRTQQVLIQANVISVGTNTPPVSPSNGNTYIVGSAPTGAWTGQANAVAYWAVDAQDGPSITPNIATGAWEFYAPLAGWRVFDNTTAAIWQFATSWVLASLLKLSVAPAGGVVTMNPALANNFRVNVNAAVTSVVISNGTADGQIVTVLWVQDGTGHTVTGFSSNIHGFTVPSSTANLVSSQQFTWDSTLSIWFAVGAGSTGI